jgi:hydroxypyruvate isomerase
MKLSRRKAIEGMAATLALGMAPFSSYSKPNQETTTPEIDKLSMSMINHSACRWCYDTIPLIDLCKAGKEIGLQSIDLVGLKDLETLNQFGLVSGMIFEQPEGFGIKNGFNKTQNHEKLIAFYEDIIPKVSNAGMTNIICFSGNRDGINDEEGLNNCAEGLKKLMAIAEKHKVKLVMELLNSKIDHKDYQCDHTNWGVELCKKVGSESFQLLYDIYHMQIMEGDIIRTIQENSKYIAHYHTGGVPGRNEIDESQELYYPAIMKAIVKTGFKGFVAQEFIPKNPDKLASLKKAVNLCNI